MTVTCWLCGFETTKLATNAEVPICKNSPCQICIEVANIDEEINQAVATLQRLLAKRCDLRSEQNRAHDIMHRLPTELRNYTFELVLPERDEWGDRVGSSSFLTSICKDWRDIAFSNPLLWSTLSIKIGTRSLSESDLSTQTNFLRNRLLRSRTLPLTLSVSAYNGVSAEEFKGVLDVISQFSGRCYSLSLILPSKFSRTGCHSAFQFQRLKRLRILSSCEVQELMPIFEKASPESIEIRGVSIQSLKFSWNHLTSAKIKHLRLRGVAELLQHASQMVSCHIVDPELEFQNFSMPLIIHERLTTLTLSCVYEEVAIILLGSLTLPSLREFHTTESDLLRSAYLPALVHRSSCPLTLVTLWTVKGGTGEMYTDYDFQRLPGVTDLVLGRVDKFEQHKLNFIKRLLLEEYFPDLCHLTLRLYPFCDLWPEAILPILQNRERQLPGATRKGMLHKIRVVDPNLADEFDYMVWDSDIGSELYELPWDINKWEGGFELLCHTEE